MTVMGIVNTTPDSFWAASRGMDQGGLERALGLVEQGADLLDIGGESTRPGSSYVSAEQECARVVPVVKALRASGCPVPLSIDTRKLEVMEQAHREGATWLNDVSALQDDPRLGPFAAEAGLTVVLMHRQGHPDTMQKAPHYDDVVREVTDFLARRAEAALAWGIPADKIVLDPGFGFGKTLEHSLALFAGLEDLRTLGFPILVGVSRKSFLGALTGAPVEDRLAGSLAAALACLERRVDILRVHDVAPTVQALKVWKALGPGRKD